MLMERFEERETAAKRGRPIFTTMLRSLTRGQASGVVIHKIDRSARNLRDWADLGELIDRGVQVHFANESLDLHTRGGRLSADEVQRFIDHSPLLFRFETGQINQEQFYREVCAVTGFSGPIEEFGGFFADIFTPIEAMVELHARLRARGIPTFILSNTNDLAVDHIRRNFPFFSNFTGYVFSFQHGVMKPDARLYQVVERMAGIAGEQILFLDDRVENVAGVKCLGSFIPRTPFEIHEPVSVFIESKGRLGT